MADKPVVVGIAEMEVVRDSGKIATYALGSCVGVCLYDYKNKVAGMVHILLPSSSDAIERSNPCKFADSGCKYLMQRMLLNGARQSFVTAKIVGGATMFAVKGPMQGIGGPERAGGEAGAAFHERAHHRGGHRGPLRPFRCDGCGYGGN